LKHIYSANNKSQFSFNSIQFTLVFIGMFLLAVGTCTSSVDTRLMFCDH